MSKWKRLEDMTVEELKKELEFTKECLRDAEYLFEFTFNKSSLHIGAQQAEAMREWKEWAKSWRTIYPKAVRCIEKDLEELLNFYDTPEEMRVKLRTTNECNREGLQGS